MIRQCYKLFGVNPSLRRFTTRRTFSSSLNEDKPTKNFVMQVTVASVVGSIIGWIAYKYGFADKSPSVSEDQGGTEPKAFDKEKEAAAASFAK